MLLVADVAFAELVMFELEGELPRSLAVEGLEAAPSRCMANVGAFNVSLGVRVDTTTAFDGAEAWLTFGAAMVGFGGHVTLGPHGSPRFWHGKHLSWFDQFLSRGSHCCGLDSKRVNRKEIKIQATCLDLSVSAGLALQSSAGSLPRVGRDLHHYFKVEHQKGYDNIRIQKATRS